MKNMKNIIIYGIIIVLCLASILGYFIKGNQSKVISTSGRVSEKEKKAHVEEVMKNSIAEPEPNPIIGVGQGTDFAKVTDTAIENSGELKAIIKKGNLVLIKPNLCTITPPGSALTTDYRVVEEVVNLAYKYGAGKVVIAEGPIFGNAFDKSALAVNKYNLIKNVELINLNDFDYTDCYGLTPKNTLTHKAIFIPKVYMDADVVISVAKLKTHFQPDAVVSLSLKNSFGVPPGKIYGIGEKDGLHDLGLKEAIVDINKIRKPDFAIIDGIIGGEGYGPINNTPVKSNVIFAGKDPVALDTVALTFMGFRVEQIPHVKLAGEEKLGISDLKSIKIKGADINKIKMKFTSELQN
jgi:uncharacterized protein (DUF362 family)